MIVFLYDKTFDGLLTAVFDAYSRQSFPEVLQAENEILPLFCDESYTVITDEERSKRVWNALKKKLSSAALSCLTVSYLSELPELDMPLFRYICKTIDAPKSIETNFSDQDVLFVTNVARKVSYESHRMWQFVRFQKAADGTYFSVMEPLYNALPLAVPHFKDRFGDQPWLIYDGRRKYGYYYDKKELTRVTFEDELPHLITGQLDEALLEKDEKLFQDLWRTYFKAVCIRERMNPKKHKKDMPVRFWKYLTEKQEGSNRGKPAMQKKQRKKGR